MLFLLKGACTITFHEKLPRIPYFSLQNLTSSWCNKESIASSMCWPGMLPSFALTVKRPNDGNGSMETLVMHCWIEEEQQQQILVLLVNHLVDRRITYYSTHLYSRSTSIGWMTSEWICTCEIRWPALAFSRPVFCCCSRSFHKFQQVSLLLQSPMDRSL